MIDIKIRVTCLLLSILFILSSGTLLMELSPHTWYNRFIRNLIVLILAMLALFCFQAGLYDGG
jgi:amino acid permease